MNHITPLRSKLLPLLALSLAIFTASSCRDTRIKEQEKWGERFQQYGINKSNACFIMRDHAHETVNLYNKDRCLERFTPASTFKIFNSLVALEIGVANDDALVIPWDSVERWSPDWSRDMDMREAFRVSNVPYYQELARRVGRQNFQHFLDSVQYGNKKIGPKVDQFWLDNSLKISADEQVGFIKRLYFEELPFIVRTQSMVKSMMLREDSANNKYYYKTGSGTTPKGDQLYWIVGYLEHVVRIDEDPKSMNKSGVRNYPYFFALNFEVPKGDSSRNWYETRTKLLHELLNDFGATRDQ